MHPYRRNRSNNNRNKKSSHAPVALVTNALEFAGPPAVATLAQAGFQVVAHDVAFVHGDRRDDYQSENPEVRTLAAQTPETVVDELRQTAQRLDVLVSNDVYRPVHEAVEQAGVDDLRDTLERLVVFPFALAQAAIPLLKLQTAARVVMITSNRTRLPLPVGAIPDAARAAANALVKSLSLELAPLGIPVNAIAPNFLYSEAYYPRARFVDDEAGREFVRATVPAGRLAEPEEIGELIRYLATMQGTFMTGAVIDFSGGWPVGQLPPA